MKRCVFINLDRATARRRELEASFAAALNGAWRLERFAAVEAGAAGSLAGSLRPAEKACFASHRAVIADSLADEAPLMVLEDDVAMAPQAFAVVESLLAQPGDWDVLFTEVGFSDIPTMAGLARRYEAMAARGEHAVLDLAGRSFVGATAYVVRGSAKARLHAMLAAADPLDVPYDLYLRELCTRGHLRAGACFPFLHGLTDEGDRSQIRTGDDPFEAAMKTFRRLMFTGRDLSACAAAAQRLADRQGNPTAKVAGALFGTFVALGADRA